LLGLVPELTVMENIMLPVRLSPRLDGAPRVVEWMVTGALRSLAALGCAVVIGTHDVSVIRNVDRIVRMTDGALQP
jgi:ABC-type lipoprotein export system ATPase subunit